MGAARPGLPVRARRLLRRRRVRHPGRHGGRPRPDPWHRRQPRLLHVGAATVLPGRDPAAGQGGPVDAARGHLAAGGHREAVRSRPARRPEPSTTWSSRCSPADSVFRIDHYLGKETVQNLLAMRFANQMFEPIWNSNYVDHVQITMAEDIGIGGRAGYYDGIGAARDVIQNHLLQLLALTAMEEPVSFDAADLRAEKEKVLSAVRLPEDLARHTARGQYAAGWQGDKSVIGYLNEEGIPPGLDDRDLRRDPARHRHPPLGRGAVLPAHRQAAGPAGDRDRGGLQAGPAPAVRADGDRGARAERDRDPGAAGRGHHDPVRLEGAGHPDGGARRHDGLRLRQLLHRVLARRPTSGSSSTCCSATRRCSPGTRRSSCRGRSSTRSPRTGPRKGAPEQYRSGTWGPAAADAMMARDGRTWRRP